MCNFVINSTMTANNIAINTYILNKLSIILQLHLRCIVLDCFFLNVNVNKSDSVFVCLIYFLQHSGGTLLVKKAEIT